MSAGRPTRIAFLITSIFGGGFARLVEYDKGIYDAASCTLKGEEIASGHEKITLKH